MKNSNLVRNIIIAVAVFFPLVILIPSFISGYNHYKEEAPNYGECVDYAVTDDGRYAWAALVPDDIYLSWDERNQIYIRLVDLAGSTVMEEYFLPAPYNSETNLFTQDGSVYLSVRSNAEDDDDGYVYSIYRLAQGQEPQLLSDTLHTPHWDSAPYQWQNRIIFVGVDAAGRYTMLFLEGGALHTVELETAFPQIAGNTMRVVEPEDHNEAMPLYNFYQYDSVNFFVGPWREASGLPPAALSSRDEASPDYYLDEDEMRARLIPQYYTAERTLALQRIENGADRRLVLVNTADMVLGPSEDMAALYGTDERYTYSYSDLGWVRGESPALDTPPLFNAEIYYLSPSTAFVAGTRAANPTSERLLYWYDGATNDLQPLPAGIGAVFTEDSFGYDTEVWRSGDVMFAKNWSRKDGILMNLANGTALLLDIGWFEGLTPPSYEGTFWRYVTTEGLAIAANLAAWIILPAIILIVVFVYHSRRNKQHKEMVEQGVHLEAEVRNVTWTHLVVDDVYNQMKVELEFEYQGQTKTGTTKVLIGPGQVIRPGDGVYIAYNPQNGKIAILNNSDEVNEEQVLTGGMGFGAGGGAPANNGAYAGAAAANNGAFGGAAPVSGGGFTGGASFAGAAAAGAAAAPQQGQQMARQYRFATVADVQPTGYTYKTATVVRLTLSLEDGRTVQITTLQADIAPYNKGEVLEVDVTNGDPFIAVASRAPHYKYDRRSILTETVLLVYTITRVEDPGIFAFGKKLLELELVTREARGTMVLARTLLMDAGDVVPVGAELPSGMDVALFERRIALQNKQQAAAVVQEVEFTGACHSVTPFCRITLAVDGVNGTCVAEEGQDVAAIPKAGQRVWVGYDPQTRQATIIKPM